MTSTATDNLARRHDRLAKALEAADYDALIVNPGPGLLYLTGLHFHLMERPTVAFFRPGQTPAMVFPEFETAKVEHLPFRMESFTYTEKLKTWDEAFEKAVAACGLEGRRIGVEPRSLRFLELEFVRRAAPSARFDSAEAVMAELRMYKDDSEIERMRKAVKVAQQALRATLPAAVPGISERELAGELTANLLRAGSEPELPFPPIVAFGPNSANPHASPTDRALAADDLILFDWGASVDGYFSDLTRVFRIGRVEAELEKIADIVHRANQAAVRKAGPGVPAGELDRAARDYITEAGYGDFFIHRTGHGLGLEDHEDPYIRGDNEQILRPGMTFTIEPGIYLKGLGGVRIEDDVVITEDGAVSLSDMPRELLALR